MRERLLSHILRRFEFYLAGGTIALTVLIGGLVALERSTASTALIGFAGLFGLQVAIYWADRERQRRLRAKAIHDIREMLTDQVLNRLATLKVWAASTETAELVDLVEDVDASIDEVAEMVTGLSQEQLDTWQLRYAHSDAHAFESDVAFV